MNEVLYRDDDAAAETFLVSHMIAAHLPSDFVANSNPPTRSSHGSLRRPGLVLLQNLVSTFPSAPAEHLTTYLARDLKGCNTVLATQFPSYGPIFSSICCPTLISQSIRGVNIPRELSYSQARRQPSHLV